MQHRLPFRRLRQLARAPVTTTEVCVATLQQTIAKKFLDSLSGSDAVNADQIEQLRKLLADSKKVKAEDLVKIFTAAEDGDVK
jgi:hypothetical protein